MSKKPLKSNKNGLKTVKKSKITPFFRYFSFIFSKIDGICIFKKERFLGNKIEGRTLPNLDIFKKNQNKVAVILGFK